MRLVLKTSAIMVVPFLLWGCPLFSGRCNYESRYIQATGSVTEGITTLATATVSAGALRGSENRRNIQWTVSAPSLEGHVTSITLVSDNPTDPVRFALTLNQSTPFTYSGDLTQEGSQATPALGGVYEAISSGQAVIEITTDLPSRPLVTVPLAVSQKEDWSRPYCS